MTTLQRIVIAARSTEPVAPLTVNGTVYNPETGEAIRTPGQIVCEGADCSWTHATPQERQRWEQIADEAIQAFLHSTVTKVA